MSPNWTSSYTQRFEDDVAHYLAGDNRLGRWKEAILRNPTIGKAVDGETVLPIRDYDAEGHVIRYMLIPTERHVEFLNVFRREDAPVQNGARLRRAWRLLVDLAGIGGLFK